MVRADVFEPPRASQSTDGEHIQVGDHGDAFTIQSISKLLLYGLALETHGREHVLERVGVAPTGDSFNAIVLDDEMNRAPNPMVNAGAIAVTDLVVGDGLDERVEEVRSMYERYLGRRPEIDRAVWESERATGNRNRAIAYLMLSRGIIRDRVEETLDLYFAQCSVLVTADDLATIGATIANHGVHPETGEQVVRSEVTRDLLTVALTCGMYDYAGEWAFSVGIPAKSGVGGGIVGILPGVGGLAVFSPRLDGHGNSVRGLRVFEELSQEFENAPIPPRPPVAPSQLTPSQKSIDSVPTWRVDCRVFKLARRMRSAVQFEHHDSNLSVISSCPISPISRVDTCRDFECRIGLGVVCASRCHGHFVVAVCKCGDGIGFQVVHPARSEFLTEIRSDDRDIFARRDPEQWRLAGLAGLSSSRGEHHHRQARQQRRRSDPAVARSEEQLVDPVKEL
jgi:glutaminase